jgi:hypothetical protein
MHVRALEKQSEKYTLDRRIQPLSQRDRWPSQRRAVAGASSKVVDSITPHR